MTKTTPLQMTVRHETHQPTPENLHGLSDDEVNASRAAQGDNRITRQKPPGFWRQFFSNLNDPIIRILLGALALNILFLFPDVDWYECSGIALAVFISAFVSTVSEHASGKAFARLYEVLGTHTCTVHRNGIVSPRSAEELVCGDIVELHPGEVVPADGVLRWGEVRIDTAALTGESHPVTRTAYMGPTSGIVLSFDDPHMVFRGSAVCSGTGIFEVLQVGDHTVYGAVAAQLQAAEMPSPLKERLAALARRISHIGYISAAFVALAHLIQAFWLDSGMQLAVMLARLGDLSFVWSECLSAMTVAISILVVAVPEGLPMMITVVLSSNMRRMMKNGVLVRRLVGIETAGSLSILFTDKTGTLTTGDLTVSSVYAGDTVYEKMVDIPSVYRTAFCMGAGYCGGCGNATERALETFLSCPTQNETPLYQIPFDSSRKYSAGCGVEVGYIRGAAELLFPYCTTMLAPDGTERPLHDAMRQKLLQRQMDAAAHASRVVIEARFPASDYRHIETNELSKVRFCFTCLWFLQDAVREGVSQAVEECHTAGIQVVMLTGDNEWTAAAIGERTGILPETWALYDPAVSVGYGTALVLRGKDLAGLSDERLSELLPSIRVISRVTPTDKSRLVRVARELGHVVGMTGDGINDAPALKAADVGFAMGSGTDVAREAGDIVITNDHFASIGQAIWFGRTIFQSIRKFVVFQLIMNLSAVGVSLLGPLLGYDEPVTVIQMLWVNIIMDTLGSLAFAGEAPLPGYMREMPIGRRESILTGDMVRQIVFSAGYVVLLCLGFLTSRFAWYRIGRGDTSYFLTVFFALFVFCGVHVAFTVRTPRIDLTAGLRKNRAFLVILPAVACIQLLIVYFGGSIFHTVPLSGDTLLCCWLLSLTVLPVDAIRKWGKRRWMGHR